MKLNKINFSIYVVFGMLINFTNITFAEMLDLSIDLGSSNINNGLTHISAGDGDTVSTSIGGIACRKTSVPNSDYYFYFDADDLEINSGNIREVFVTVEYYDNGSGGLLLQYDSLLSGSYKSAGAINRTNSNTWKTYTWRLTDAYFDNNQNWGTDFRLYGSGTVYVNRVFVRQGEKVISNLGSSNDEDGLIHVSAGSDGLTIPATIGGLNCRRTASSSEYSVFQFDVTESFAFRGNRKDLYITMHYYDNGTGYLALQHDSVSGGAFKTGDYLWRGNSNTWKSYTWHVDDALFNNRQNASTDFRIAVQPNTHAYIDMVYVRDFSSKDRRRVMTPRHVNGSGFDRQPLLDLMNNPSQWQDARNNIGMLKIADKTLIDSSSSEINSWVSKIQDWGKLLAIDVPAIKDWGPTGQQTFDSFKGMLDDIVAQGGTISDLQMDEPFTNVRIFNHGSWQYAVNETAKWIELVRDRYPNTKIASIEALPYNSASDLEWWIASVNNECAALGVEGLDYFVLDVSWNGGYYHWASLIEDWCDNVYDIPFGNIFWASGGTTDYDWYNYIFNQANIYVTQASRDPHQYIVQSWMPIPSQTVPDYYNYTFTKSVKDFFNIYGQ